MTVTLDKIDLIRARTGVSYAKANEALEASGGDVVQALIKLEQEQRGWQERISVAGNELVDRVKELVHEGNVTRILIKQRDRTLLEIPVTVGAVGAVLFPYLAALGVIATLVSRSTIVVERRDPNHPDGVA